MTTINSKSKSRFSFITQRPVAITMITLAFVIFGYLSTKKLPLNLMPDLSYPTITIRTEYKGSAPEEVEKSISKQIEQLVGVVNNLESISSISKAGQSDVILEFSWDASIDQAILDVREQLDRFFFQDAEKPLILRYDPSLDPIMRLAIYRTDTEKNPRYDSDIDFLKKTRRYAEEEIKRKLEVLPGVAAVKIKGGLEEEIRVQISEKKLNILNLNIRDITSRLRSENVNVSGGNIKEGQTEYIVRTLNEFQSINEIKNIIIGFKNRTTAIYLKNIATIKRSYKERKIITRFKNRESVEIEIFKEANANIVDVAQRVLRKISGDPNQRAFVARKKIRKINRHSQEMTDFLSYQLNQIDLAIDVLSDQSIFIKSSIDEVKKTAFIGGILAIIILFIFLRDLKSTIIVGVTIPVSILSTFWPMDMFGVSINLMSLGGLALGIGMLVDNAIVVLESIYRCREEGDDFLESVIRGTQEVSSAVIASTLTTIAVFSPIVFVEGVAGQIFGDMALTVVFSLLASLVAAIFLIPMLASRQLDNSQLNRFSESFLKDLLKFKFLSSFSNFEMFRNILNRYRWSSLRYFFKIIIPLTIVIFLANFFFILIYWLLRGSLHLAFEIIGKFIIGFFALSMYLFRKMRIVLTIYIIPFLDTFIIRWFTLSINRLQSIYPNMIGYTLNNKMNTIFYILIPSLICFTLLLPRLGSELIPEVHQGEFNLEIMYNIGTPVERTSKSIQKISEQIKKITGVKTVSSRAGIDKSATTKSEEGEHSGKISIRLYKNSDMETKENEVIFKIRNIVKNISGIDTKITRNEIFSFKTPVEIFIKGYKLDKLKEYGNQAVEAIKNIEGIVDVKSNIKTGNPEVHIIYDRIKVARYNLNILEVAKLVKNKILGDVSTKYRDKDRRIDITVLLADEYKQSINDLRQLIVNPGQEKPIMLSSIAQIKIAEGPSEIRRVDQERTAIITANITGERDLKSIMEDIETFIANMPMADDFFYELAGQNEEMETSINSLIAALLLAIFLVYIIMASQFESFVHPFVILFSIPLALVGVIIVLFVAGISLSIMTYLGMIMLAGIVVNNAIVLVSHINLLRREYGMEKEAAIKEAGRVRLRPILMTTATTVLGLLPMALGLGDGSEMRQPMALTVIAGLISSTLLTLIVIPTLYAIFDRGEKPHKEEHIDKNVHRLLN